MKAKVVVDNIANGSLKGEWGLCIYIENEGKKILLDAGGSNLFATNAKGLGINIEDVDVAVLSHAHYDHSNGMIKFFELNKKAKFYLRETAAENCYKRILFYNKYIGLTKNILTDYADRIEMAKGDLEIFPGVYLIPHKTPNLEACGKRENMYQKTHEGWKIDNFSHEQSLVIRTDEGLVVFNCCSHGGADNIINEVSETFKGEQVIAIIGGFHLYNKTEKEVRSFANRVKETGIKKVVTGHCTGKKSFKILKDELGDTLEQLHVGLELNF